MMIKALTLLLLIIFSALPAISQNIQELEKRKGFKTIKLGMAVDSLHGVKLKKEFKEQEQYPAKLFSVDNDDYARIGEVEVKKVEVKTYKDLIYEIRVVADKDPRLMKALESLYGRAEYDLKNETYFWKTDSLILKFKSEGKNLELVYISYTILKQMKDDKNQKVNDIADDF